MTPSPPAPLTPEDLERWKCVARDALERKYAEWWEQTAWLLDRWSKSGPVVDHANSADPVSVTTDTEDTTEKEKGQS